MSSSDLGVILIPRAFAVLAAVLMALALYRTVSGHVSWAPRLRRLLERDGFSVRRMERRWLTRGPFPDMRPPGAKHSSEWLIRVVAEDREHQPRSGWVRWRRRWPWETQDRWAVSWDATADPHLEAPRMQGVSSAVFFSFLFLAIAVVLTAIIRSGAVPRFRVQGAQPASSQQARQDSAVASADAAQPAVYELRCRGGGGAYRVEQLGTDQVQQGNIYVWTVTLSLKFEPAPRAAGLDGRGLDPGTCSWIDRPLNDLEPREIRCSAPAIRTTGVPHEVFPEPGTFPNEREFEDSLFYWSFFVFNTNNGFLEATKHNRWTPTRAGP
jgi:hypothetical protein